MLTDEEIAKLDYHSLRTGCSNVGLRANGNTGALRSRLRTYWSTKRKEQQQQQRKEQQRQQRKEEERRLRQEQQRQHEEDFRPGLISGSGGRFAHLAPPLLALTPPRPPPVATAPPHLREQLRVSGAKRKARSGEVAAGTGTATPQGKREEESPAAKRRKPSNAGEAGQHLLCPISLELPIDPVTADDGCIYDRRSIQDYFNDRDKRNETHVMSPYTRQKMSKKILPSPQIRSHIESLVGSGAVSKALADRWLEGMEEWKKYQQTVKKAERGDVEAMIEAGRNYYDGLKGFPREKGTGYRWFDKARIKGSVVGSAYMGEILLNKTMAISNETATQNTARATMYLTSAAERGSDYAAFVLGMGLAHGKHGLPFDRADAQRFLKLAGSGDCEFRHLSEEDKKKIPGELVRLANHRR